MPRQFYARSAALVAPDLVGALLVVDRGTAEEVRARIVEVEAYLGGADPASHAHRGPTQRSAVMFGPPGHLYVYFSYGMHHCANLVCSPAGTASAVLLRGAEVEEGEQVVRERRGSAAAASSLLSGPGNLCRGLAISAADNGLELRGSRLCIEARQVMPEIVNGPRVGISRATDLPLRFWHAGHRAVSGRRAIPAGS